MKTTVKAKLSANLRKLKTDAKGKKIPKLIEEMLFDVTKKEAINFINT